jgi:hypothetical protein
LTITSSPSAAPVIACVMVQGSMALQSVPVPLGPA